MPGVGLAIAAALAALGIILVLSFITISFIKQKLKERYSNFWKARIKDRYETLGVPVVEVEVEDLYGNNLGTDKFASLDGISSSIEEGDVLYN